MSAASLMSPIDKPPGGLSDDLIASLVGDMDRRGYATIEDFFPQEAVAKMKRFVSSAIAESGGGYVGFKGSEPVAGSGLDELAASSDFRSIFSRMYELSTKAPSPEVEFYQILRCLTGADAEGHSFYFHYDSYLITALVPIEIPTTGRTGDFLMLPNTRRVRTTYGANLLDKMWLDNVVTQKILRSISARGKSPFTRIHLKPGNLYFFWGYRSIHTNEPCDPEHVRATALFHFANPHENSGLRARFRTG